MLCTNPISSFYFPFNSAYTIGKLMKLPSILILALTAISAAEPPQPRFPGLVSEEFVFTKATFPQCHASTICETSSGLICAWFGGTEEQAKDVGIWVSHHDGTSWAAPRESANGVQHADLRHPCWNPVLFQPPGNASTMLFFKVGPSPSKWWGELLVSHDQGRTFGDRKRLPEGFDGPVRCKPILIDNDKTLLCGSSTEYDGWRVHFEKLNLTNDQWKRIGPINSKTEFSAIQPTFLQHPKGKLQVLCRTKQGVIATSFSEDKGETWSKMTAIDMPNPNSGIDVVTLKDGRFLMIYNHLKKYRNMLNLAISDDGVLWKKVCAVENEKNGEFSYPAIIQSKDGLVHMTYTWRRQRIKHVTIDPARIQIGAPLTKAPW
jgi:predicted neuraminidase